MQMIARDISVSLEGKRILHDINFAARAGEVTVILGQNGSGKTTLTRALTGELAPDTGDIHLNEHNIAHLQPWQLALMRAVLPQSVSLAFPFTVREVVRLGVEAGGGLKASDVVDKCLSLVGLSGYAARKIHQLSGGEQQRVHLARVLAQVNTDKATNQPRWLFLDEPVSSLDLKHQIAVMDAARAFAKHGGGVIAVLHDLNLAAAYADKIHMLAHGKTIASGEPKKVMTPEILSHCYGITIACTQIHERHVYLPA